MGALLAVILAVIPISAGAEEPTLTERLGYARDAKLIIVHTDDMAQAHAINLASMKAFEKGIANNASILATCPWLPEVAAWASTQPQLDLGLQAVLTSEHAGSKWGPILGAKAVPSLVGADGYFPPKGDIVLGRADPREAEAEIRAQLAKLRSVGIEPTYMDTHMGVMFGSPELFTAYLRIAREAGIPALILKKNVEPGSPNAGLLKPTDVVIDEKISSGGQLTKPAEFIKSYGDKLKTLGPGVYFLEAHMALDNDEMKGVFAGKIPYGAKFRQGETNYFMSKEFARALKANGWQKITWREVGQKLGITPKK